MESRRASGSYREGKMNAYLGERLGQAKRRRAPGRLRHRPDQGLRRRPQRPHPALQQRRCRGQRLSIKNDQKADVRPCELRPPPAPRRPRRIAVTTQTGRITNFVPEPFSVSASNRLPLRRLEVRADRKVRPDRRSGATQRRTIFRGHGRRQTDGTTCPEHKSEGSSES